MNSRLPALIALVLPALALAAATARQELQTATRAKPDVEHGALLYAQCVGCHGPEGRGTSEGARPIIAGQHFRVIVKQLVDFRHDKHWDVQMEDVAMHRLKGAQDIADVAAYVSQMAIFTENERGAGDNPALGVGIYQANCASCHGPLGQGRAADGTPRLAGQHYGYLLRQIYDAVDGRRPSLSPTHRRWLEPLSFEEVKAVADHLSRLPGTR
jgi:cytochrome c553